MPVTLCCKKEVSTFSSLNKVSNKILRVIFLLSILWNRSDIFSPSVWNLKVKREVLQNSSEQTPDLGVDQNLNLPRFYWLLRGCKGNWVKFVLLKQSHGPTLRSNSTTSTRPSPFAYTVYMWLEEPGLLSWLGAGVEHLLKSLNITVDKMT